LLPERERKKETAGLRALSAAFVTLGPCWVKSFLLRTQFSEVVTRFPDARWGVRLVSPDSIARLICFCSLALFQIT
jgi:hypothetical protein